jgi:hypothetical protein
MDDKMMDKKEWGVRLLKAISIFIGASLLAAFSGTSAAPAGRGSTTPIVTGTVTYLQPTAFMSCEDE